MIEVSEIVSATSLMQDYDSQNKRGVDHNNPKNHYSHHLE